jgi:hypothetical protein
MTGQQYPQPMRQSGSLDQFEKFELTPILGTEFRQVDVTEWLTSPDSDRLLQDLAILSMPPTKSVRAEIYELTSLISCRARCGVLSRTDEP